MKNADIEYQFKHTHETTWKTKKVRGRVTDKRVDISICVFDKTGKRISAYRSGASQKRLLSFCVDGSDPVFVNSAI